MLINPAWGLGLSVETLPLFWEAQQNCLEQVPNCAMVVITDITVDTTDIHPVNKRDVGRRLARCALARDYRRPDVVYSGPVYRSMSVAGATATLSFEHAAGGLRIGGGAAALSEFTIAGQDGQFVPATAVFTGQASVAVSSCSVGEPAAVRFSWHETAVGNLTNGAGLPASPFRTDGGA